jgi:hypothetical protein
MVRVSDSEQEEMTNRAKPVFEENKDADAVVIGLDPTNPTRGIPVKLPAGVANINDMLSASVTAAASALTQEASQAYREKTTEEFRLLQEKLRKESAAEAAAAKKKDDTSSEDSEYDSDTGYCKTFGIPKEEYKERKRRDKRVRHAKRAAAAAAKKEEDDVSSEDSEFDEDQADSYLKKWGPTRARDYREQSRKNKKARHAARAAAAAVVPGVHNDDSSEDSELEGRTRTFGMPRDDETNRRKDKAMRHAWRKTMKQLEEEEKKN